MKYYLINTLLFINYLHITVRSNYLETFNTFTLEKEYINGVIYDKMIFLREDYYIGKI
jgi:hypothetical protein